MVFIAGSSEAVILESINQFEQRKRDHIRIALDASSQAVSENRLNEIELVHEALPELDLADIRLENDFLGAMVSPLFVSSMTAGHADGFRINLALAKACAKKNWLMGVGSQRRQLTDPSARQEWEKILGEVPGIRWIGNIGLSQVIHHAPAEIGELIESLRAKALIVHTNPLQEAFQPEGTPLFKGGLQALEKLCKTLALPVILKETGCGFSRSTLQKLRGVGLYAVDVAGLGGTHWGRVEGARSDRDDLYFKASQTFANWGISTVDSLLGGTELNLDYRLWASGGVRSGLDAAKLLAMGADKVGFAQPMMEAALAGYEKILEKMDLLEYELKVALFCTGCADVAALREKKVWQWKTGR